MFRSLLVLFAVACVAYGVPAVEEKKKDYHVSITFNDVRELTEFNKVYYDRKGVRPLQLYVDSSKDYAYEVVAVDEGVLEEVKTYLKEHNVVYDVKEHDGPHNFSAVIKFKLELVTPKEA